MLPIEVGHTNLGKALRWEYEDGGNGVGIKGLISPSFTREGKILVGLRLQMWRELA